MPSQFAQKLTQVLVRSNIATAHGLVDYVPGILSESYIQFLEKLETESIDFTVSLLRLTGNTTFEDPQIKDLLQKLLKPKKPIGALLLGLGLTMGASAVFGTILEPLIRNLRFAVEAKVLSNIAQPSTWLSLYRKGYLKEEDLEKILARYGYDKDQVGWMNLDTVPVFVTSEVLDLFNRGLIPEDKGGSVPGNPLTGYAPRINTEDYNVNTLLTRLGLTDDQIKLVKDFRWQLPTPSDLIRFAVREVFTPEIAEKFGQFQNYPGEQWERMGAVLGYNPQVLKWYWAAHWDLPSPTQGFEMFHRGIINIDELRLLLRALDVMPYWRDRLIKLAYRPLTRVDVRRMYRLGVLTSDLQLIKAYMDLGYDIHNATALTEFTKKWAHESQRDLAMSEIKAAYVTGIITRDDAKRMLLELDRTPDTAELEIRIWNAQLAHAKKVQMRDALIDAYARNDITENELRNKLAGLGFSIAAYQEEIALVKFLKEHRKTRPTKADLINFFHANIIDENTLREELRGLHYDDRYVNWYVEYAKRTAARAGGTTTRRRGSAEGGGTSPQAGVTPSPTPTTRPTTPPPAPRTRRTPS